MSIAVTLQDQNGNALTTRQFQRSQPIIVSGHVTGLAGIGESFVHYRVEIPEIFFISEGNASIFGNFSVPVTLPDQDQQLTIQITATFPAIGQDVVAIPIAVGSAAPAALPAPPVQGSWPAWAGPALAIAAVVAAVFFIPQIIPTTRPFSTRR